MLQRFKGNLISSDPSLTSNESRSLEKLGYAVLPSVFSSIEIKQLAAATDQVFADYPASHRTPKLSVNAEDEFRHELFNKSRIFLELLGRRDLLNIVEPLLGNDCHVIANTAWKNSPSDFSHGGQKWHIDAGPHVPLPKGVHWPEDIPFPVFVVASHVFLQDCGLDEGPTGVIPRSHLSGQAPPRERALDDSLSWNGSKSIPPLAKAGDVVFFVSDVWHRRLPTGSKNRGRYFIQIHYGRRDIAQRVKTSTDVNHVDEKIRQWITTERQSTLVGLHKPYFYDG